jgi:small subunit ribosomal protein S5
VKVALSFSLIKLAGRCLAFRGGQFRSLIVAAETEKTDNVKDAVAQLVSQAREAAAEASVAVEEGDENSSGGGRRRRRDRRRGKDRDKDREKRSEARERDYAEILIDIYRCSATVKGGRRLSFGALVAVGNGKGRVGFGYAKAKEVPGAIQKAIKKAYRDLNDFALTADDTIPHQIEGVYGASRVILIPARPGTGVIAGTSVKAILEAGGVKNVLTKCVGNTNSRNMVRATMSALTGLRSKETVAKLRQIEL